MSFTFLPGSRPPPPNGDAKPPELTGRPHVGRLPSPQPPAPPNTAEPLLAAFFEDIEAICRKHGMSIAHQDHEGAFIIEKFNPDNIKWLRAASDEREGESL